MDVFSPSPLIADPPRSMASELGALLRLSGPLVGSNLLQMSIAAVDVMFVARLGPRDLAAATLGAFLFNLLCYALIGLGSAAAPLIAAELGRRAHAVREVRRSFRMAMWVSLIGAIPTMLLLWDGNRLLLVLGQEPDIAARTGRFLIVLAPAVPLAAMAGIMRVTAAALGRPGWAFVVTGVALALDLFGNWALIFGHCGLPALGLIGSAAANLICFAGMALAYGLIFAVDRRLSRYRLFGRWYRFDRDRARDIVRLGAPIMATWLMEGGLFGGAAVLMGLIGVTEMAAHAVALNIAAFAFQIPFGISQAATVRVGMAYGARDARWVAKAGRCALMLGIGIMAVTAMIMWIAPRLLVTAYLSADDPASAAVADLAVRFLAVAAVFQLADGAQVVSAGVLRGLQDTRVPMLVAAFGYWGIGFSCSIALGFGLGLRGVGIWWGLAAGLLVVAILLGIRWHRRGPLGLLPWPNGADDPSPAGG